MSENEADLSRAFDGQAALFERAPVQTDPAALSRLVAFAAFPVGARILDAGCGPGLVAEALLDAGCSVYGVDLSPEMVRRARERCARFGGRARFELGAVGDAALYQAVAPFDGAISRFVVHHTQDPLAFVRAQVARVRPGGAVMVYDHTGDPDPKAAQWHEMLERARDRTHTRNLSPDELVEVCVRAGLVQIAFVEEAFELDFDEWFDRGTPAMPKTEVRRLAESGTARGMRPTRRADGGLTFQCFRGLVRGVTPG